MKQPDEFARRRIDMMLAKIFLELEVDPNDVVSMTVGPTGITFTVEVPMVIALDPMRRSVE